MLDRGVVPLTIGKVLVVTSGSRNPSGKASSECVYTKFKSPRAHFGAIEPWGLKFHIGWASDPTSRGDGDVSPAPFHDRATISIV